jgi:N,N'-diacetyllegionaminate synthase
MRTFIIAEAGVNHNGNLEVAMKMVDSAVNAGVDAVKFQTFHAENVSTANAPKAEYQMTMNSGNESQLEMLKELELDFDSHRELMNHCRRNNIMFLSSPFDIDSIDMLNELGLEIFKIPSGEIVNLPYLRKIGTLNKKVILSTGMAEMEEIKDALDVIVDSGTRKENITVLHCNTEYPTPYEDVNLRAMLTIKEAFDISVGYSDHTPGIDVAIAAVALGAEVIEKHFTLDRNMEGPDHKASLEADELKSMVVAIRNIETAFGNGVKKPSASEIENRAVVRKSIVASRPIKKGELFTEESITVKRPGIGISPMKWDNVIGRTSKKNFEKDGIIEL